MTEESELIDLAQLAEAAGDSTAVLSELVELYLRQAHEIVQGLERAIQSSAARDVEHLAHRFAGASAACGIRALVGPLRGLEQLSRTDGFAKREAEELLTAVRERLLQTEKLLYSSCPALALNASCLP